jgi:hypothetical protein
VKCALKEIRSINKHGNDDNPGREGKEEGKEHLCVDEHVQVLVVQQIHGYARHYQLHDAHACTPRVYD